MIVLLNNKKGDCMAKRMKQTAFIVTAITLFCVAIYIHTGNGTVLTLAITFGTTSYHFIMRLLVGFSADLLLHNHVNYRRRWFQVSTAEQKLYHIIQVKSGKEKFLLIIRSFLTAGFIHGMKLPRQRVRPNLSMR